MVRFLALPLLLTAIAPVAAQDTRATQILERFQKSRPNDKALAFYQLDWAKNVGEATTRAKREGRPVLVVWVTNITASCNFYAGHC